MIIILCSIFGLIIGSFLNVVILRLPAGKSLSGRSGCVRCGHQLTAAELVPVFSYLFLRGRCAHCGEKISSRYAIIELTTAILFGLAATIFSPVSFITGVVLLRALFTLAVLVVIFAIDFEHYLILDQIIFPGLAIAVLFNIILDKLQTGGLFVLHGALSGGCLGAIILGLMFFALWFFSRGRWLGFGDVKLVLFLGMALGWPQAGVGVFLGILIGGAVSVWLLVRGRKGLKSQIPFGTFLSVGSVLALFWGQILLRWYLALLGF